MFSKIKSPTSFGKSPTPVRNRMKSRDMIDFVPDESKRESPDRFSEGVPEDMTSREVDLTPKYHTYNLQAGDVHYIAVLNLDQRLMSLEVGLCASEPTLSLGDLILEINGAPIDSFLYETARSVLQERPVTVKIRRYNQEGPLTLILPMKESQNVVSGPKGLEMTQGPTGIQETSGPTGSGSDLSLTNTKKRPGSFHYNRTTELMKGFENYCEFKRECHYMAATYYKKMHRLFVIPSIFITALSGILSFLASSSNMTSDDQFKINVTVGSVSALSTIIQGLSTNFGYGTMADAHQNAVESYDQLLNKVKFQRLQALEADGETAGSEWLKEIEKQITETKQRCKYIIPSWVERRYYRRRVYHDMEKTLLDTRKQLLVRDVQLYLLQRGNEESNIDINKLEAQLNREMK